MEIALFTFSDLTYVLFPVRVIWKLNMPLQRKVGLCALMALSLVTMIMSILKTISIKSASLQTPDALYDASLTTLWANVEQCLVIIMGCIPPLHPIKKIGFASFRSANSSLAKFVNKSARTKSTGNSSRRDRYGRPMYYDLEAITTPSRAGEFKCSIDAERDSPIPSRKGDDDTPDVSRIRRTDQFTITYSDQETPKGKV